MEKKKIIIIVSVCILLLLGVGVGSWIFVGNSTMYTEAALEPLEEDPGNVAEDAWTARY